MFRLPSFESCLNEKPRVVNCFCGDQVLLSKNLMLANGKKTNFSNSTLHVAFLQVMSLIFASIQRKHLKSLVVEYYVKIYRI